MTYHNTNCDALLRHRHPFPSPSRCITTPKTLKSMELQITQKTICHAPQFQKKTIHLWINALFHNNKNQLHHRQSQDKEIVQRTRVLLVASQARIVLVSQTRAIFPKNCALHRYSRQPSPSSSLTLRLCESETIASHTIIICHKRIITEMQLAAWRTNDWTSGVVGFVVQRNSSHAVFSMSKLCMQ